MENVKISGKYLLMVLAIFIMGACNNDKKEFKVNADVVFIKKIINDEPVVGTAYYAYSNKVLASCSVTPPNSAQTVNLSAYKTNTLTFTNEPSNDEFLSSAPIEGSYLFNVTNSDNETIQTSDEQSFSDIGFAQLDEKTFDSSNQWLYLTWNEVSGADSYTVSLLNSAGETIFSGYAVNADSPEFYITTQFDFGIWTASPNYDEAYTLRIKCFVYDSDATEENFSSSVQEISQKDYPIVWKLN
jgi:hypothetical protein